MQGVEFIAAFTAINRVDDFAMTPQGNIAHAATTFMAQNRGAGKIRRMKKGFLRSIILQVIYTTAIAIAVFVLRVKIMQLFVSDGSEEVISLGGVLSSADCVYVFYAVGDKCDPGILPGTGRSESDSVQYSAEYGGQISGCVIMIHMLGGGFECLAWANFAGWIAMLAFQVPMILIRWRKEVPEKK